MCAGVNLLGNETVNPNKSRTYNLDQLIKMDCLSPSVKVINFESNYILPQHF